MEKEQRLESIREKLSKGASAKNKVSLDIIKVCQKSNKILMLILQNIGSDYLKEDDQANGGFQVPSSRGFKKKGKAVGQKRAPDEDILAILE